MDTDYNDKNRYIPTLCPRGLHKITGIALMDILLPAALSARNTGGYIEFKSAEPNTGRILALPVSDDDSQEAIMRRNKLEFTHLVREWITYSGASGPTMLNVQGLLLRIGTAESMDQLINDIRLTIEIFSHIPGPQF